MIDRASHAHAEKPAFHATSLAEDRDEWKARAQSAEAAMKAFMAARQFDQNGEYRGWRIAGKRSLNEAYAQAAALRSLIETKGGEDGE